MFNATRALATAGLCTLISVGDVVAERIQPFVLASSAPGEMSQAVASTKQKLTGAGFEIIGDYSPYADAAIIVFTDGELQTTAKRSERGGYGAALRAAITVNDANVEVTYTHPKYWANAYRLADDLNGVTARLESALGAVRQFSSGDKELTPEDMREYHYAFMMEYFDDPSELAEYGSHAEAVSAIENNISAGKGAAEMVYKIDVGKDPQGKAMTLIGVGLRGKDEDDCSSDRYIMSRIDKETPRATAHLPYEMLVYGNRVEALYGRFRIAISLPHLPMMASETGATFMSIMCAPSSIQEALTIAAGGQLADQ